MSMGIKMCVLLFHGNGLNEVSMENRSWTRVSQMDAMFWPLNMLNTSFAVVWSFHEYIIIGS